jgi:hypothetical protein
MEIEFELYKGKVKGKFLGPTDEKPKRHMYYVGGKRKTGVTTYCGIKDKSPGLIIWATELYRNYLLDALKDGITEEHIFTGSTIHEERKAEAAAVGDEVHKWVEQYIKGEKPDMPERREAQIGVTAFLEWETENKVKFISSERVVYSKKHDYIGKMDIEAKVNGKLCLLDIKTSSGMYNEFYMQTAAYVKADEEESGKKYAGRWLIRLAKETEKEYEARMVLKNQNRVRRGRDPIQYPPYKVFEAKFLDEDPKNMDRDFKGFLAAKALFEFDKLTGFWATKDE